MARLLESQRFLIQNAYAKIKNVAKVARMFHVSEKTVRKWVRRHGTAERPGRGRKKLLSKRLCRSAFKLLTSGKANSSRAAALVLRRKLGRGSKLSKDTIIQAAKSYATSINQPIHCDRMAKPQQQLTGNARRRRVQFCIEHQPYCWDRVMFTDRKKFYLNYPGSKVHPSQWVRKGERRQAIRAVSRPLCLNVYVGITPQGPTKCHYVVGTTGMVSKYHTKAGAASRGICAAEYRDVLLQTLLPEGDRLFGKGEQWVLQQDGDRSHTYGERVVQEYLAKHPQSSIQFLKGWPALSPDLSPIENFWGWVQISINRCGCRSLVSLKKALNKIIRTAPPQLFASYYASMMGRVQQCMDNKGGRIKY